MSYTFNLNLEPLTFGEALWNLKEALVAGGWVVSASGDGTGGNYNASGDVHAPGGTYGGTLDLQNSWLRLRHPFMTPVREFVFHHDSASVGRLSIRYSSNGIGFTGGSPSATVSPTAADQQAITSNTGVFFDATNGLVRQDVLVGDMNERGSWFTGTRLKGEGEIDLGYNCCIYLDAVDSASASDPDPAVVGCVFDGDGTSGRFALIGSNPIDFGESSASTTAGSSRAWYDKGATNVWANYPMVTWGNGSDTRAEGNREGTNDAGEFAERSIWYWRGGSNPGKKGRSHLFLSSSERVGFLRPEGGTVPFQRVNLGLVSMPWDGATRPIW